MFSDLQGRPEAIESATALDMPWFTLCINIYGKYLKNKWNRYVWGPGVEGKKYEHLLGFAHQTSS